MSTQTTALIPSLSDAITGAEQAITSYNNAASQTSNDQAAVTAIQAKLDAANTIVTSDQQAQTAAATAANSALTTLISAAQAAMIPVQQ